MRRNLAAYCLALKRQTASTCQHTASMARRRDPAVVLGKNLQQLMDHHGLSQAELGRKSGIGQRTISTLLDLADPASSNPRLRTVDQLAGYFGLNAWTLLVPDQTADMLVSKKVAAVVDGALAGGAEFPDDDSGSLDAQLFETALSMAMEAFHKQRRVPTGKQAFAAANYVYALIREGRLKEAKTQVQRLLVEAGSSEPVFPVTTSSSASKGR